MLPHYEMDILIFIDNFIVIYYLSEHL